MKFILNYIRKEEWSPYVGGVLLGLVGIGAVWASDSLLGASGAFENLAGMIGKWVAPAAFDNMYFNFIMPPGITWGVWLLVGVFFGGMIGAATSGTLLWGKKGAANSDAQWKRIFGPQAWKRWAKRSSTTSAPSSARRRKTTTCAWSASAACSCRVMVATPGAADCRAVRGSAVWSASRAADRRSGRS